MNRSIRHVLKAWAIAVKAEKMNLGFPYKSSVFIGAKRDADLRPWLSYDEWESVNCAIDSLLQHNKVWHKMIIYHYRDECTLKEIARLSGNAINTCNRYLGEAEAYLLAKLEEKIPELVPETNKNSNKSVDM